MSERLFLCATSRLAQTLRGEIPGASRAWRTRPALTVGQWLAGLADEALLAGVADLPAALDPFAERLLWEKVIATSLSDASPLFDLQGLAASAAEAQALCRDWNLHPGGGQLSDEAAMFLAWQAEFGRRCRTAGWIDPSGLAAEGHRADRSRAFLLAGGGELRRLRPPDAARAAPGGRPRGTRQRG